MGFSEAFKAFWGNYVNFSGRASRSEYWFAQLALWIIFFVFGIFSYASEFIYYVDGLLGLIVIIPMLSLAIRRLHDTNKRGWFILLGLIPLVGWIIMLVFYCTAGDRGPNRFGEDPLAK
ncbi:hypothetical protein PGRAN_11491 [Listeria grandensis FSL F6-0971]|uniref:DUF805 domain-containing protein n=1 Tax=Listeria grandensis FSL F6-0971 TaxID=1265819 RepID=W7BDE6_9LIST|nr:DUF805 domain-containing protein [Listeria grandensis]EUJ22830.1 hypothetical protein PGRAN_11491 [Listeria grandensis FSL F6-0971]